jgi:hypothetical protein
MVSVTGQLVLVYSFIPVPINSTHERKKQCLLTRIVKQPLCYIWSIAKEIGDRKRTASVSMQSIEETYLSKKTLFSQQATVK